LSPVARLAYVLAVCAAALGEPAWVAGALAAAGFAGDVIAVSTNAPPEDG
jgi:hypothetical protein